MFLSAVLCYKRKHLHIKRYLGKTYFSFNDNGLNIKSIKTEQKKLFENCSNISLVSGKQITVVNKKSITIDSFVLLKNL